MEMHTLSPLLHLGLIFAKTQWLMIKNDIMIYNFINQLLVC